MLTPAIEIINCLHAAVLVADLDKAIEFYTDILGLQRIDRALNYPGAWYQIGDFQLHLIAKYRTIDPTSIDLSVSPHAIPMSLLGVKRFGMQPKQRLLAANLCG